MQKFSDLMVLIGLAGILGFVLANYGFFLTLEVALIIAVTVYLVGLVKGYPARRQQARRRQRQMRGVR